MKKILSVVCAIAILFTTVSLMLQPSLSADNTNLVINGDFSTEDLSSWTDENSSRKTTILKTGNNAIDGATAMIKSKNGAISQIIDIEKNCEYSFNVSVKTLGTGSADLTVEILGGDGYETVLKSAAQLTATGNAAAVNLAGRFQSLENTSVKIRICNANTSSQAAAVDNISLEKIVYTVNDELLNGDFEALAMAHWKDETKGLVLNESANNAIGGGKNVESPEGVAGSVSQMFKIDKNDDYTLSASVISDSDKTFKISILGGENYSVPLLECTYNEKTGDAPAKISSSFVSGDNTSVKIVISVSAGTSGKLYFDDIVIKKLSRELVNGDFEASDTEILGWEHNDKVELITDAHSYKAWALNGNTLYLDNENGMAWQTFKVEKGTDYYFKATGITCSFNQMELYMKIYAGTQIDEAKLLASDHEGGNTGTWKDRYASLAGEFNTGEYDRITVVFSYNAFDNFACIDDVEVAKDTIIANDELLNTNFDNGTTEHWTWTGDPAVLTIEDEDTLSYHNPQFPLSILGVFSPKLYSDALPSPKNHFYQVIKAKPLTTYEYSFYVWSGWATVHINIYEGKNGGEKLCNTMIINDGQTWGKWYNFNGTVTTSEDAEYVRLDFSARSDGFGNFYYIDDVMLRERPAAPQALVNGDFEFTHFVGEYEYGGWRGDSEKLEYISSVAANSGRYSLEFKDKTTITQVVRLEAIKNEVSFYHRGTYGEVKVELFDEDDKLLFETTALHTTASFKKFVDYYTPEKAQNVKVVITADKGTFLDDVSVCDPDDVKPIISQSTPKIIVFESKLTNIESDAENLLASGDFESEPEKGNAWNTDEFIGNDFLSVESKDGDKALKFSSLGDTAAEATIWLDVTPETEYTLSMELLGEYLTKNNSGIFNVSIINPVVGKALGTKNSKVSGITPTSYDNCWHRRAVVFVTGYCTRIGIRLSGVNTTVYIDDMILCSSDYAGKEIKSEKAVTVLDSSNATVECASGKNLLSAVDWKSGINYGKIAVYNKETFYYSSERAPRYASFMKFFEVKPNTEYVAAFKLRKSGDGDPSAGFISKTDALDRFYDISPEYSDNQWESYCVTFNSGKVTELGFAVSDGGGTLEVADLVLCESSAAVFGAPLERIEEDEEEIENDFFFEDEDDDFEEEEIGDTEPEEEEENKKTTKKKLRKTYQTIIVTSYTWIIVVAVAAAVVLAAVIVLIIIIKRKKKKAKEGNGGETA